MSNICDIHEIEDMEIILSDGCRLSARVWMPIDANADPVPAILEYLPYRKRDGTCARDALTHPISPNVAMPVFGSICVETATVRV